MTYLQRMFTLGGLMLLLGVFALLPATRVEAQTTPGQAAWGGLFYDNTNFSGSPANGNFFNGLNQNWGTSQPVDGTGTTIPVGPDNWSARLSTTVNLSGLYEFVITADDGVRFYINGQLLVDDIGSTGVSTYNTVVNLTGGAYNLEVEYVDYTGTALLQVNWIVSDGTPQPTATPAPVSQGEVVQVRGLAVRTGPFLGASLIGVARPDTLYPLRARNTQEGIFTWYRIQLDEDTVGWSSGRYLSLTGDPEALPLDNSTQFDVINQTETFDVLGQTRSVMNLRVYPSQRVSRVPEQTQIPWGGIVEILARTRQGGRDFWYQVRYRDEDNVDRYGWIFAPYVEILDENVAPIDAIPTY